MASIVRIKMIGHQALRIKIWHILCIDAGMTTIYIILSLIIALVNVGINDKNGEEKSFVAFETIIHSYKGINNAVAVLGKILYTRI